MLPTKSYTEQQPRRGDTILDCGHLDQGRPLHWFKYSEPVRFARPDGSRGEASWLAICEACFISQGIRTPVRGDTMWFGDAPIIKKEEQH